MLHVSLCGKWGQFPGFRVWQGHVGQCAGQAALLLYFSGLCNGAQLYLAHSWANKVVYYKWRSQLGLEPQSSGNISTNLVWVSNCSEMWNEVGFMRFQVLLKTFQPALVSSCCFFSFLPLMCLWYFTLNVPQSKGSYETRQKQKPLSITQQTGNCGKALERGCLSLLNSPFSCPPPCGVPPELHFIWRFLSCLAHCDNSTTYPS